MSRKLLAIAALVVLLGAAIFFVARSQRSNSSSSAIVRRSSNLPAGFITTDETKFSIDGKPFRFVGANVAIMYREEDRERMPETLREVAKDGVKVIRVWAHGEGGEDSVVRSLGGDKDDWPRKHPFRFAPDQWNEEAFVHLDNVIAEAAKNKIYVQLCLVNWWRDTGGVTQYLKWAGIDDAADDKSPYGVNVEKAMQFYSNEQTRKWYKAHVEKLVTRKNTLTGVLYKDDPTIMAWELMNEGQAPTARWNERKVWVEEMSAFIRSLDEHHLITPGVWGYRNAIERRAWIEEHKLINIDFADVHNYPRDDLDSFVDSPNALKEFLANRSAAAYEIGKPLVMGEFGMGRDGYQNYSEADWYRAFFEHSARLGVAGAMYWIFTPDPKRGYGVTYTSNVDDSVRAEIKRGAEFMTLHQGEGIPEWLKDAEQHLIPRQFSFARPENDPITKPQTVNTENGKAIFRFRPEAVASGCFERIGGGDGYIWGLGMGYFEYITPERNQITKVNQIIVRAALKPVEPFDSHGRIKTSNVTLFINGTNYGSRLVELPAPDKANIYEWIIDSWALRWSTSRGNKMTIRFVVEPTAENPYGLTIANFPYDSNGVAPVEVELK
jgi:mannan endo-1,4-beta-mannosidase